MSPPLPPLPDFIYEKLAGKAFVEADTSFVGPNQWQTPTGRRHLVGDDGSSSPSQSYLTADLKAKILAGDFAALSAARLQNQLDLQPNCTTINQSQDSTSAGFVTSINPSNNQEYRICASDAGWIWSYTTSITTTNAADGTPTTQCVVQTGSYSKNGQILGLSYQTLNSMPVDLTALAASAMVALVVGNMIKQLILGAVYEAALNAAVDAAAAGAVAGGFMVGETAVMIGTIIVAGLGAGVVAALVAIIIFYIADFIHRSYGLTVQVYNWDPNSTWNVTSWYADNSVIAQGNAGSGPWKAASLLPVQNSVPGPFGPISTTNPVAQYAVYAYQNDSEWLEGLGLAMSVACDKGSFYLGYDVKRFAHNLIALSQDTSRAMADWYNDSSSWRPSGDQSYTTSITGYPDITVTCITDALDGNDRAYNFDVHIGLQQSVGSASS